MSTRSRSSFRSLHSNLFQKTRHAKREKFKEAIEQFFDKLHHHHRSEFGHATHVLRKLYLPRAQGIQVSNM
ncbi:hypothetical protein BDY19DRAFT_459237 [Irpex rosettiformis]|uniref:Uncharacterized protein n=1 Tax=Irpex rosettiformis TaxID=378272 RepID=A0ACB8TT61_9APHY|nr:hypothetical protein BDY19DRAFT_459237 [Irpex rosettiformis]